MYLLCLISACYAALVLQVCEMPTSSRFFSLSSIETSSCYLAINKSCQAYALTVTWLTKPSLLMQVFLAHGRGRQGSVQLLHSGVVLEELNSASAPCQGMYNMWPVVMQDLASGAADRAHTFIVLSFVTGTRVLSAGVHVPVLHVHSSFPGCMPMTLLARQHAFWYVGHCLPYDLPHSDQHSSIVAALHLQEAPFCVRMMKQSSRLHV